MRVVVVVAILFAESAAAGGIVVQLADPGDAAALAVASEPAVRDLDRVEALRRRVAPDLPSFARYRRIVDDAAGVADLEGRTGVVRAWVVAAVPPPAPDPPDPDRFPPTPELASDWLDPAPVGLGVVAAWRWPGAMGGVVVGDVEYDVRRSHEDLWAHRSTASWGWDPDLYAWHGTSVVGVIAAVDDGFGTIGAAPDAEVVVFHPYAEADTYDPAAAVLAASTELGPGDVLLIEQQGFADTFVPISRDPLVHDAIVLAVAAGIVVVEPAGNGGSDLDDPSFEGWFSRDHDSGSIVVGAGDPVTGAREPTSNYGSRVDVQGWATGIVAPTTDGYDADLFDAGPDQAYTSRFGGTSGASAQVAGLCAQIQGVSIALHGEPVPPERLRRWLVATGRPQPDAHEPIGPVPDVDAVVRTWLAP